MFQHGGCGPRSHALVPAPSDKPRSQNSNRPCYKGEFVPESILSFIAAVRVFFRSRSDAALEILALRQQVATLNAADKWSAFLRNHREAITALDFFAVPTVTFRLLRRVAARLKPSRIERS